MRRFVVIGRNALAAGDFLLDDLPGTSGRLDIGLRCVRAGLLVSHGVRRDAIVYLVLCAGPRAPRVLRFSGADARFLRPDERSLALLAKKVLAMRADEDSDRFVELRDGIAVASGGVERVIADLGPASPYVLERDATDIRETTGLERTDCAFFVGDHLGFDDATRACLSAIHARPVGVGPSSLHAEDVIAVVWNEIDRRLARGDNAERRT
jgi:tRNA (pseudouridine54-N1)-methyltransferase